MPDYWLYNVKVSALTPLHIGSGVRLLHEYDYAIRNKQTWRINDATLLDERMSETGQLDLKFVESLARTPPARLLDPKKDFYPENKVFRYVIQGTPRSAAEGAQVQEALKDTFDHPFIPGGSLKGALRTALAWVLWEQLGVKSELSKLGRRKEWAGQRYEQEIFGRDPNHDLLRALQVSDSQPVSPARLMILNVRALNRGGKLAAPIELEAIRPDTVFEMTLKIDRALYSGWAKARGLELQGAAALEQLEEVSRTHARQRIQDELAYYKPVSVANRLSGFYQQLEKLHPQLGSGQFFLQLGWGTGWDDKTFGSRLKKDAAFFVRMVNDFRLARGEYVSGRTFPASRRVAVTITKNTNGQVVETPAYPLGWVLVEMERVVRGEK